MLTVGGAIRRRRLEVGLTLQSLAARAGCTKGYLSTVENDRRPHPPSDEILGKLESALGLPRGRLLTIAQWQSTPGQVKAHVLELRAREAAGADLARVLRRRGLDELHRSGELRSLIEGRAGQDGASHENTEMCSGGAGAGHDEAQHYVRESPWPNSGSAEGPRSGAGPAAQPDRVDDPPAWGEELSRLLPVQVPVINAVTAGRPAEFTDLGYPARVADDYVSVPDLYDPDAFAARITGDSMAPDYREGDVVVFSPAADTPPGADCFVRFERDDESTFKRIFFGADEGAGGGTLVHLVPLNRSYPVRTVGREAIAGMYAAVSVVRRIGPPRAGGG